MKKTQIQPSSDFDNKGNRTWSVREKRVAVVCVIVIAAACISSIVCLVYFLDGGKKATGGETPSANTTVPTQYGKPPPYILGESGWITWGSWSSCDVTCGGGSRVRSRVCYTTDPSQTCHGKSEHISSCAEWNCPDCNQGCQHGVLNSECLFCECQNDVISGTTKDIAGRPLEGVSIYRAEYPVDRIAVTAATGYFEVVGVCSADYTLMIKSNSFVDAIVSKTNTDRKRRSDESSVHLNITLEREVPPVIVKHPRNKVRTVGQSVRLCCAANGKPSPDYYEWFKDSIILDQDVYHYNDTLTLTNLDAEDSGEYTCRANSEAGAQYSLPATLVIVDNGDTGCSSKPLTHLIKLPTGCTDGSGSNSYNIGKCSKEVCASQEDASIECVNAEEYCCSPVLIDDVTVLCDGFDVSIQVVSECGCMACGPPTTKVIGRAGGVDGVPLPYGDIYIDGEHVGQTSATGEFSIEVSKGKKRLALTFRDKYNLFIDSATKIINILDETEVYHQIFIQRLADPVTISATEKSTVPLGTNGHIELDIPGDGFYTEDGLLYTGDVKATVTFNDPSDPSAADTMESDFTTRDIEGNTQLLKTYGVFNMKFQDESSNNLRVDAPMEIFINADQANIDLTEVDDDGNPSLRLWILNQISGEWEDFGGLGIVQEKRKKRDTENFLVGNIDVTGYDLSDITINLDKPMYWSCFLKVRVYEDEAMKQLLEGVQVTAITNDLIRRTHSEIGIGAGIFSFFKKETTDAEGTVCMRTFCSRDELKYSVNIKAEHGDLLQPVHPNDVSSSKHPSQWPQDLLDSYMLPEPLGTSGFITMAALTPQGLTDNYEEYTVYSYDYDVISPRDFGPFYWNWRDWDMSAEQRCKSAPTTENHLVFVKADKGLVSINYDGYDITNINHYENHRSVRSWYPYERENKKACFIKILVDSSDNARFRAISSGGGHPEIGSQQYGLREDSSKPSPPNPDLSSKTAACIEFKCSGPLRIGHPVSDTSPLGEVVSGGADTTHLNVTAITSGCQLKSGSDGVNPGLLSFIESYSLESHIQQDDTNFQFKVPDGNSNGPTTGLYFAQGEGITGYDNAYKNCNAGDDNAHSTGVGDNPDVGWALQYECN